MLNDPIIIETSKCSLYFIISASIIFIGIGFWLFHKSKHQVRYHPATIKGISIFIILFFLFCSVYGFYRVTGKRSGLIIDREGIRDDSSETMSFIYWKNIRRFELIKIHDTKLIGIFVDNPDEAIGLGSGIREKLMSANYRLYGTPVIISCVALKCDVDELLNILLDRFSKLQ